MSRKEGQDELAGGELVDFVRIVGEEVFHDLLPRDYAQQIIKLYAQQYPEITCVILETNYLPDDYYPVKTVPESEIRTMGSLIVRFDDGSVLVLNDLNYGMAQAAEKYFRQKEHMIDSFYLTDKDLIEGWNLFSDHKRVFAYDALSRSAYIHFDDRGLVA